MNKIWRCDLKSPCVKYCESENDKHLCGIRIKDKRNKMLKVATLFSGIGTPEQSLKHLQVEHETVFACEIDKYARTTYLANNETPNTFYDDVYNIDGNKYKNQIDILIGGSPCQSFSIAGKRQGTSCPRGNLIYEYFRIVEESQPKVFIYENVKGFLSIDKGETFKNFVQSFKDLGYTTYHQVLNTKDHLIPQNRERIYIVGFKDNVDFHFQEKQELKLRLNDMLEDEVDEKYLLSEKLVSYFEKHKKEQEEKGNGFGWQPLDKNSQISFTITNPGKTRPNETYIKLEQTHTLNIKGNDSIKRIYSSDGLCPSLTTMQGGHREPKIAHPVREVGRRLDENGKRCDDNKDIPITRRYEIGEKEKTFSNIKQLDGISSTITANAQRATIDNGNLIELDKYYNEYDKTKYIFRKLTPRECFRLQGFDDNFIFPPKMSDTQLYKQAGNGMSRNILDMIFTQIFTCYAKHIENTKE